MLIKLPGNFWLEAFLCYSKSLFFLKKIEEAIYILKQLLSINLDLTKERNLDLDFDFNKVVIEHMTLVNGVFPRLILQINPEEGQNFWNQPKSSYFFD